MRTFNLKEGIHNMTTVTEELLTYRQVAKIFAVSTLTVRRWALAGELPFLRLSEGTIRFRRSDIDAFIEKARAAVAV